MRWYRGKPNTKSAIPVMAAFGSDRDTLMQTNSSASINNTGITGKGFTLNPE